MGIISKKIVYVKGVEVGMKLLRLGSRLANLRHFVLILKIV
jgi:hypothetical protein